MSNVLVHFGLRLLGRLFVAVWSLALLAFLLVAGYYIGERWGISEGDPNGVWYGLLGGFLVWALFLRPRRRRRRGRWDSDSHDGGGGWFADDGDGGDSGGCGGE